MYVLCFIGLLVMIPCMTYTDSKKCNGQSGFDGHNGRNGFDSHNGLMSVRPVMFVMTFLAVLMYLKGLDTFPRS